MHERNDLAELCTIHAFLVFFVFTAGNGPFKVAQERRALKLLKPASDFEIPFAHVLLSKIQCIESAVHASVSIIIQAVRYVNQTIIVFVFSCPDRKRKHERKCSFF